MDDFSRHLLTTSPGVLNDGPNALSAAPLLRRGSADAMDVFLTEHEKADETPLSCANRQSLR
jgi:hypothetical protein